MTLLNRLYNILNEENLWLKTIELKRNEFLKKPNKIDTNLYFVEKGSLRLFIDDGIEEMTIRFGYEKNFIGALDSILKKVSSPINIQALKSTTLKVVRKQELDDLREQSQEVQALWNMLLEELVYQQMEREYDLLTNSPAERYKRVLERSPQLFQHIPHKYIASYLRMTPETLSRIKKS